MSKFYYMLMGSAMADMCKDIDIDLKHDSKWYKKYSSKKYKSKRKKNKKDKKLS